MPQIVPLANFDSYTHSFDFGNGYSLELLDEHEAELVRGNNAVGQAYSFHSASQIRLKLLNHIPDHFPTHRALDVIRAFRLCHKGRFACPLILDYDSTRYAILTGFLHGTPDGTIYQFRPDDCPRMLEYVSQLGTPHSKANNRLQNVLQRLDDIYARDRLDEQIVDCFVALESCLVPQQGSEIGYKLSLRSAALLAKQREPQEVQTLISAGYDARSKFVHSGISIDDLFAAKDFKKKLRRLAEVRGLDANRTTITHFSFTGDLIECLRITITQLLDAISDGQMTIETLVDDLDNKIAAGLASLRNAH